MRPPPGAGRLTDVQRAQVHSAATVLILNTHGIGDALMSVPTISQLVAAVGVDPIELVVRSPVEGSLFQREIPGSHFTPVSSLRRPTGLLKWARRLRSRGTVVTISLYNVEPRRAYLLSKLVGSSWAVGFVRGSSTPFDVNLHPTGGHKIDENLRVLSALGIAAAPAEYTWTVEPEDRDAEVYRSLPTGPFLALTPGSHPAETFKRWSPDAYGACLRRVLSDTEMDAVLLGSGQDRAVAEKIHRQLPPEAADRVTNLAGRTSLHECAAVMQRAALVLGGDGGLTHVGAALGVPVIVLAGPVRPSVTGPRGPSVTIVESSHYCTGCYERNLKIDPACGFPHCMAAHDPGRIADLIIRKTS